MGVSVTQIREIGTEDNQSLLNMAMSGGFNILFLSQYFLLQILGYCP